ncbi:MAG: hypothetical protein AAGA48_12575 [Myxococcota bacterium]
MTAQRGGMLSRKPFKPASLLHVGAIALAVSACGEPLLSERALEDLFDVNPLPNEPGWVLAWQSQYGPLVVDCEPVPTEIIDATPASLGEIVVDAPFTEPARWISLYPDEEDFKEDPDEPLLEYALGYPILVDLERYRTASERDGPVRRPLSFDRGVWGVGDVARLHTSGDTDEISEIFPLILDADEALDGNGATWVDVNYAAISADRPELALSPVHIEDEIRVFWTGWAGEEHLDLWSGAIEDGTVGGCP